MNSQPAQNPGQKDSQTGAGKVDPHIRDLAAPPGRKELDGLVRQGNKQGETSCKCESGAEMDLLDLQQKRRPQQPQQGKFRHVGHFTNEVVGVSGGNVEQLQQRVENVQDGPAGLGGLGGREEGVPPDKRHAGHSSQAGEKQ